MVCRRGKWGWVDCRTGLNLLKVLRWELFSFIAVSTRTISCSITISTLIWFPDKKVCIAVPLAESVLHSLDCSRNRLNWPSSLYNLFQVFSSSTWTSCGTLQKKKLFQWLKRYSRLFVHHYNLPCYCTEMRFFRSSPYSLQWSNDRLIQVYNKSHFVRMVTWIIL